MLVPLFLLRRTLTNSLCWKAKGFCSTFASKVSEQCRFKNTRSSDLEAMRLTITVSVLDPSTHFPSIFINARLSQVFKSPTPAIAFVRFASLPRRFTPLSAVTAFSILLSFIEQTGFNKFDFAKNPFFCPYLFENVTLSQRRVLSPRDHEYKD